MCWNTCKYGVWLKLYSVVASQRVPSMSRRNSKEVSLILRVRYDNNNNNNNNYNNNNNNAEGSKHHQKKQQRSLSDFGHDHDENADGRANDESSDDGAIPIQTGSPRQKQQEQQEQ